MVKTIFIDFAGHGDPSVLAAEATHCAQEQGQFWAYHDLLFDNFSTSGYSREQLDGFAAQLNLDSAAFAQCLNSRKYRDFVQASTQEALRAGVRGTPTIFVNQQAIPGFLPFQELKLIIEEELKKQP